MIGRFGHSVSPALLGLLAAEALTLLAAFAVGPVLWRTRIEPGAGPEWGGVPSSALVYTAIVTTILIALGLYERQFWRGRADMLLRVGISVLFGRFALALVGWLFPILALSHGALNLAIGLAGAGVLLVRYGFLRATRRAGFKRQILVLGIGEQAARLERLRSAGPLGCRILGYVQAHGD